MSYVIGVCTKNQAIVMSDGRALDCNGNILTESYQKITKVNDHILIGFAGDIESCKKTLSQIPVNKKNFADDLAQELFSYMSGNDFLNKAGFVVIGTDHNGQMILCAFGLNHGDKFKITVPNNLAIAQLLPSDYCGKNDLLYKYLTDGSCSDIADAMKYAIMDMAELCQSVNNHIYSLSIGT